MTPDELAEIRAREQAATPGPWTWSAGMIEAPPDVDGRMEAVLWAANIPGGHDDDDYGAALGACGNHTEEHAGDNLAFLAHAREDVPKLLAHVADLEAQLDEITDLDRSALKHQELRDDRSRAVRMWRDEKKRADTAEARVAELEADRTEARWTACYYRNAWWGKQEGAEMRLGLLPEWLTHDGADNAPEVEADDADW